MKIKEQRIKELRYASEAFITHFSTKYIILDGQGDIRGSAFKLEPAIDLCRIFCFGTVHKCTFINNVLRINKKVEYDGNQTN